MKQVIPPNPSIGLCIATHSAVAYVHLGLEALKRNEPKLPVLVHDDSSKESGLLKATADAYNADFATTDYRKRPTVGDLSAFVEALKWGESKGLDIVVKCSRRFIINRPFVAGLQELMHNTQYATACAPCAWHGFGYRSELVAMHIGSWIESGAYAEMRQIVEENRAYDPLPEAYYHRKAREVHAWAHPADPLVSKIDNVHDPDCDFLARSENTYKRPDNYDAYAWWMLMGLHRHQVIPDVLWHDSAEPRNYAGLAQTFGLPYAEQDFVLVPGQ